MKNNIGKSSLLITASKFTSLIINLLCAMILSRMRTLQEYGTYSQLLMVNSLVSSFLVLGLPNSINYFLAKSDSAVTRHKFLNQYFTISTILAVLSGMLLLFLLPVTEMYFRNPDISSYAFFLLLYPFASITMSAIESILVIYERPLLLVTYRFLNSLSLLGVLIVSDAYSLNFHQYLFLFLFTELTFAVAVLGITSYLAGLLRFTFDLYAIREIFAFCAPIGLASAVGTISLELDKLLITHFFSTAEYAIYANAAKELPLTTLVSATTMVAMPKIVQMLHKEKIAQAVNLWKNVFVFNYTIMGLLVFGIVCYAPEVITILYSDKYIPGVTVFRIYTCLLLLRCAYFGMFLSATGETKPIFKTSIIILVLNVFFNILLYYWLGFIGPAIATVLTTFFSAYMLLWHSSKKLGIPIADFLPLKELFNITIICCTFAIIFSCLKKVLPIEILMSNIIANVFAISFIKHTTAEIIESVLLGCIWAILYCLVVYKPMRYIWNQFNIEEG